MIIKLDEDFSSMKESLERMFDNSGKDGLIDLILEYEKDNNKATFSIELVKKYIETIKKWYPNVRFDFNVIYGLKEDYILDSKECKILESVDNYIRNSTNSELYLSSNDNMFWHFGFRRTLDANRKLDSIAKKIKNSTNNGAPLSNFEKFMIAYEYVTNFVYNEGGDIMHTETSHWVPVLEGDKIVCAGYSSLLRALCDRIFSPTEVKVLEQGLSIANKNNNQQLGGHGNNIVFIKDDKYNIDGMFYVDSCWDSINESRKDKPYSYCCIPLQDIMYNKEYLFEFDNGFTHLYLSQFEKYANYFKQMEYERYKKDKILSEKAGYFDDKPFTLKGFEREVEEFFQGYKKDGNCQRYFSNCISTIINYDTWVDMFEEDKKVLETYENEYPKTLKNKYNEIFNNYSDVKIPGYLPQQLIEYYKLENYLDVIDNHQNDEEKVLEALDYIGKVFSQEKAKMFLKKCEENNIKSSSFEEFIINRMSISYLSQMKASFQKKKTSFEEEARKRNAFNVKEYLNEKSDSSPIPIQAFINSYKIIGAQLGLDGEQLKQYVSNRIKQSIERTHHLFEVENCQNCFATISIEEFERGTIKKK